MAGVRQPYFKDDNMGIKKDVLMGSGVLASYHEIIKVEASPNSLLITATINSYSSEEAYLQNKYIVWQQPVHIPLSVTYLSEDLFKTLYEYLVTDSSSVFLGGTIRVQTENELEQVKLDKIQHLEVQCSKAIISGFKCDALGELYSYPAKVLDQSNLVASVLSSVLPGVSEDWTTPFWCANLDGLWEFRSHTCAQIQKVGVTGKQAIVDNLSKNEVLASQIRSAETIEQVNAITWETENVQIPGE